MEIIPPYARIKRLIRDIPATEITAGSNMSEEDIEKAVNEAKEFEAQDKKRKEAVETKNGAEAIVSSTEQAIKEAGDKITEDDKSKVQAEVDALKAVLEKYKETEELTDEQVQEIKDAQEKLMNASQPVFTKMYEQAAQEAQAAQQAEGAADAGASQDDNVEDADYEEV